MKTNWDGTQTAPTLTANNAGGSQRMPDKENFNAIIGGGYRLGNCSKKIDSYGMRKAPGIP